MRHLEDTFFGLGGTKLFYQVWSPDRAFRAIVQLVHGILEDTLHYSIY
jgi:alpha-beta hydrolase superfamily lysophospholipase